MAERTLNDVILPTAPLLLADCVTWAAPEGWQGGQLPPCALALAPPVAPPGKMLVLLKCPVVVKDTTCH